MYSEDGLLPISALQHLAYCERQCALIHIERAWEENRLTAEGRLLHERVHEHGTESRGGVRIVRGLALRSLRLGLVGIADVVEFHRDTDRAGTATEPPEPAAASDRFDGWPCADDDGDGEGRPGASADPFASDFFCLSSDQDAPESIPGESPTEKADSPAGDFSNEDTTGEEPMSYGAPIPPREPGEPPASLEDVASSEPSGAPAPLSDVGRPFPVEYKRGRAKKGDCDRIQLCAQALCLEEMLGVAVPCGALFYGSTRRRVDVEFTPALRATVEQAATRLRRLIESGRTPPAVYERGKCDRCSLADVCLPRVAASGRRARRYLESLLD